MSVSVLIPTTGRRPELLARVRDAVYEPLNLRTITGYTWGEGLNVLARRYVGPGDYFLTCCDDTVPHVGCVEAGLAMLAAGFMPVQRYFTVDGEPVHDFDLAEHGTPLPWTRGFLLPRDVYEAVGPFIDASWYVDLDYSERLQAAGWELRACDGYSFTHLAGERDWLTPEVQAHEKLLYEEAKGSV